MNLSRLYKNTLGIGLINSIVSKASIFINLWLINQILIKTEFGNYIFAFTTIELLILFANGGLDKLIVYKYETISNYKLKNNFINASIGLGIIFSTGITIIVEIIAYFINNNSLAFWFSGLAILIPIKVGSELYASLYRAKQLVPKAIIMNQILPNIINTLFLIINWLFLSNKLVIIIGALFSPIISTIPWIIRSKVNPFKFSTNFSFHDIKYSIELMLTKVVYDVAKKGDIIIIGILTSESIVAEYTIASKISVLILTIHQILEYAFASRVSYLIKQERKELLFIEFNIIRDISSLFAIATIIFFMIYGKALLNFMGDYAQAYSLLLIFSCTYMTITIFGCNGMYLSMSGYVNYILKVTSLISFISIIMTYFLINILGVEGAAISSLITMIIVNFLFNRAIFDIESFNGLSLKSGFLWISVITNLLLTVYSIISVNAASIIISISCLLWIFFSYNSWKKMFSNIGFDIKE